MIILGSSNSQCFIMKSHASLTPLSLCFFAVAVALFFFSIRYCSSSNWQRLTDIYLLCSHNLLLSTCLKCRFLCYSSLQSTIWVKHQIILRRRVVQLETQTQWCYLRSLLLSGNKQSKAIGLQSIIWVKRHINCKTSHNLAYKSWQNLLSFCHNALVCQTDGQTAFSWLDRLHSMQRG